MGLETVTTESSVALRALEKKAIRASVWSILEYGSNMGLRIVSSLVLTRLLAPAYFGEITLVMTLIVGINLLSDFGLAPSVIQSPQGDDPDFLNTAWTIQVLRGIGLWLIAIVITLPMAIFYHDPQLKLLLPILALSTLISSFNSTNLLTLSRHLGVRRLFAIDGSTAVVSLVVTIIWAYFWPSVWAIVAGQIVSTTFRLIVSHIPALTPGIRNTFCWDKKSLHSIVHFGKWILVGTAFFFFASQADRLILGRLISLTLLGVYGLAYQLSDVPRQIILALGGRVAYPFISKLIHMTMEEFRAKYLYYRFYTLLLGSVLLSLMVVWGNLIILLLYDRRYHQAAWMIPILAVGLWHTLLYQTTAPVLFALGKPRYNAIGNAGYCIAMLVGLPLAFHFWGMTGAVIAVAAGDLPLYLVVQTGATREGVKPLRQDLQMTGIFIAVLGGCFFIRHFFS
ncbi:MAG: oligosaccharide flippase family protein [Acidobacteria bacterium]|nr:oligosaccharide flippase family protein [Acidobacteriota bacterium]